MEAIVFETKNSSAYKRMSEKLDSNAEILILSLSGKRQNHYFLSQATLFRHHLKVMGIGERIWRLSPHLHQIYAHSPKALLDEPAQPPFLFTRNALLEIKSACLVYGFGGEIEVFSRIPSRRPKFSSRIPNGLGLLHSLMREGRALGQKLLPLVLSSMNQINARRLRLMKELMGLSRGLLCNSLSTL
jgi:hypothetical protein